MISILLGTRPEIIKLAPVIQSFSQRKRSFILIHSNQHYSENMDRVFFTNLGLPSPDYNLQVGSGTHGIQTGKVLERVER
ncbi:MAG: UDP-N-acetylglucosamine 2-epimerase, partial [Candidatus Cloacimonetes bacterium]|nr:UDP-N-acetylglucosamine 2-epimerase [Candidatus Cloacimonadota bacterium]